MIVKVLITAALLCFATQPAHAELQYYPDPVYKKLSADDHHPMDDMIDLAKQGDVRAQFMIADMYMKGKGGLAKDLKEARRWFEESAMHGYGHSFVRLAAMAKRAGNNTEAWQWYTLAADNLDGEDQDYAIKARKQLVDDAKLSRDDISNARKSMRDWEDVRDKQLRDEKDQARQAEKDAAKKEKEDKAKETSDHNQPEEKKE